MPERPKRADPRPTPRLYLMTPAVADASAFAAMLGEALDAADIAAVLLRLADTDERTLINHAKALCPLVQSKDTALLLDGRADLAARAGADGAHLTGITAFSDAFDALKPDRIAGVGGLASRHDAMAAAERGTDYVMFGEPDASGARPSFAAVEERVAWWAEVFEIPCVGYAASLEEIAPLVKAGADFVALGDWLWQDSRQDARQVAPAIASAAALLRLPETAA
jgi:thiamine-phosphate pyrophosphorylase